MCIMRSEQRDCNDNLIGEESIRMLRFLFNCTAAANLNAQCRTGENPTIFSDMDKSNHIFLRSARNDRKSSKNSFSFGKLLKQNTECYTVSWSVQLELIYNIISRKCINESTHAEIDHGRLNRLRMPAHARARISNQSNFQWAAQNDSYNTVQ